VCVIFKTITYVKCYKSQIFYPFSKHEFDINKNFLIACGSGTELGCFINIYEGPMELEESTVQVHWKSGEEFVTVVQVNVIHVQFISAWPFYSAQYQCLEV
jgi:hypothetical protein